MSLSAIVKKIEWVVNGRVEGGECPDCGNPTIVVEEDGYSCSHCDFEGDLPEAPEW